MKIFTSISLIISVLLSLLGMGRTPDVKSLDEYNHDNTYEMSMLSVNKKGKYSDIGENLIIVLKNSNLYVILNAETLNL